MTRHRPLAAIVLYGGWLLLFNPDAQHPDAPLRSWKRKGEFDTAYLCDQKKREKIRQTLAKQTGGRPEDAPITGGGLELRYRCERVEHVGK